MSRRFGVYVVLIGWFGAVLSISGCGARSGADTSPAESLRTIAVLGDSLAVSPSPDASFPAVLQRRLEAEGYPWRVRNFSRNGAVTADGVERVDQVLAEQPDIVVLALGANDGLRGVPAETMQQHLDAIITRATGRGIRVLLCGMETPPVNGIRYSLSFRSVFPSLARQHDLPLVPFLLTGVVGRPDLNREDWVHPNARGAARIAETVWAFLEPMVARKQERP